jgi:tetratricopeptide (TPR) repeat protein
MTTAPVRAHLAREDLAMSPFSTRRLVLRAAAVFLLIASLGPAGRAQNYKENPSYGTVTVKAGEAAVRPTTVNVLAGGNVQTNLGGVGAWVASPPDARLHYTAGNATLVIRVESSAPTTLLVNLPNGEWIASGPGPNGSPSLRFDVPKGGQYDIWVGTPKNDGKFPKAKVVVAELSKAGGRFLLFTIENRMRDTPVSYQINWNDGQGWADLVTLRGGEVFRHWYNKGNTTSNPTPTIRYNKGTSGAVSWTNTLQATAGTEELGRRNGYIFWLNPGSGTPFIELYPRNQKQEAAADEVYYAFRAVKSNPKAGLARVSNAVAMDPESSEAYRVRAIIYEALGGYDAALWDLSEIVRQYPGYSNIYFHRGNVLYQKKQFARALEEYDRALLRAPTLDSVINRSASHFYLGDFDSALEEGFRALKIAPKSSLANNNIGAAYLFRGEPRLAIGFLDQAVALGAEYALPHYLRGLTHEKLGNRERAREDFEKAETLKLDPTFTRIKTETQAKDALDAFHFGSTLTPEMLGMSNELDKGVDPLRSANPDRPIPDAVKDLIYEEWNRYRTMKFEAVKAADLFFKAARTNPEKLAEAGMKLEWLYGPTSSPIARQASNDDLGGLRIIGSLKMPNGRFINMIFARGYQSPNPDKESRGGVAFLEGGDNARLVARVFNTGKVEKDFLFQSFSIKNHGDRWTMRAGFYLDELTGTLINEKITESSMSGRCMHCHDKGSNLSAKVARPESQAAAIEFYLGIAKTYGASYARAPGEKREVEKLRDLMTEKGPSAILPLDALYEANRRYWWEIYREFLERQENPAMAATPQAWHRIGRVDKKD